jgi:stress-induced morphogen
MSVQGSVKRSDAVLRQVVAALEKYQSAHPRADISAYRQNSVSVRIRVISSEFKGKSRGQREDEVWACLNELPEEAIAEISLLLLLAPGETKSSIANAEFDNPIPSRL